MLMYSKISQWDDESTTWYLVRAKVLLEGIHWTSKLSEISGYGMDNLSLICGLWEHYRRKWVMKEQESWCMMEGVLKALTMSLWWRREARLIISLNMTPCPKSLSKDCTRWVYQAGMSNQELAYPIKCILVLSITLKIVLLLDTHAVQSHTHQPEVLLLCRRPSPQRVQHV